MTQEDDQTNQPPRALLYLRRGEVETSGPLGVAHCRQAGYEIQAVTLDDPEGVSWPEVLSILRRGQVDVVVTAHRQPRKLWRRSRDRIEVIGGSA